MSRKNHFLKSWNGVDPPQIPIKNKLVKGGRTNSYKYISELRPQDR